MPLAQILWTAPGAAAIGTLLLWVDATPMQWSWWAMVVGLSIINATICTFLQRAAGCAD